MRVFIFSILFLAGVATYPLLVGQIVKQQFNAYVAQTYPSLQLQLIKQNYRQGWWMAYAETNVHHLQMPEDHYVIVYQIQHRFPPLLPVQIDSRAYRLNAKNEREQVPIQLASQIAINGQSKHQLYLPPFQLHFAPNHLNTARLTNEIHLNHVTQQIEWESDLPSLTLYSDDDSQARLTLRGLHVHSYLPLQTPLQQKIRLDIQLVELNQPSKNRQLKLQQVRLNGHFQGNGDFIDLLLDGNIAHYNAAKDNDDTIQLQLTLQHLHAVTLQQLLRTGINYFTRPQGLKGMVHLWELLRHEPSLKIQSLRMRVPAGDIFLSSTITLQRGQLFALWSTTPWRAFDAQLELKVPQTWLNKQLSPTAQQQFNAWRNQGYINSQQPYYHSQLQWQNQQLQVNGASIK